MKKTLLLCLSIACLSLQLTAQSLYPVSLDEKTGRSELIVEGRVTEQRSFWNPLHTMIYTSNTIEVYKVFKGTLTSSTIEIVTEGGTVGTENVTVTDLLELSKGETGVFFCYTNQLGLRSPASNRLLYDVWSSSQGFFKYNPVDLTVNAPFVRINDIESGVYRTLEQKTGARYREIKPFRLTAPQISNRVQVTVSSFSPTTVNAGATLDPTNNVLTITGTDFGTASGSAAVFFDDANDGSGGSFIGVAFSDPLMISWSSTSIVVRVPARAGTGVIIVQDDLGNNAASATNLNIRYSILTGTFSGIVTKEINLMNTNGSGGYTIQYSTSTAGGGIDFDAAPEKATFQRALSTWTEIAGFNAVEGATTTNQAAANDGINTIMFDNTNTGVAVLASGVLGVCRFYSSMCTPVATNEPQRLGFDITLRNAGVSAGSASFTIGPCAPASSTLSDLDLETVILHELGHAIGLGHINDSYQGSSVPNINPGKLMNFALVNSVKRSSPDFSAYAGALYLITPQSNTYGGPCGLFTAEMTPLATTTEAKDECPGTFPTVGLNNGTVVAFDLVHATSNINTDPQFTRLNCAGTGTGVTNTAYYAFRTAAAGGTSLLLTVSGYGTTPASQAACTPVAPYTAAAGVELALYAVSSCPTGQAFPVPVACRTFNANGALASITVSAGTTYLLIADGIENTKANFSLTFGGTALPINLYSFTGEKKGKTSWLKWQTASEYNNDRFEVETSKDGTSFYKIGSVKSLGNSTSIQSYDFTDVLPVKGDNYYRLKQIDKDGKHTYSKTVMLNFDETGGPVTIYPNPALNELFVSFARPSDNVVIQVFAHDGKLVKEESLNSVQRSQSINVEKLSTGVYIMKISTSRDSYQLRFIKN